jgi:starch-binding outer membrane protein SusE/F
MKNIQGIIYLLLAVMLFTGCEKLEREPVVRPGDAPSITQPQAGTQLVFDRDNATGATVEFSWSEADYGFPSATTYSLQAAQAGSNFATPVELSAVNDLSVTLTHATLNNRFMMAGLSPNEAIDMEFRVVASVSPYVTSLISQPVPATVTLYAASFPSIYMIGAAVGGWATNLAVELVSTGEPSVYTTIAYFDVANGTNFRFFNNPEWGASLGGYDVFTQYPQDLLSPATSDDDPNFNFTGTPGWYELVVNTETGTISMEAVGEPVMYLTGDATHGWNWDDPVTSLQWVGYQIWEGDVNFTQNNAFRLFPQKDWGPVSYGYDVITNYNTEYIDVMQGHGDPNWQFKKPSGTYHVRVDLRNNSIEIKEK